MPKKQKNAKKGKGSRVQQLGGGGGALGDNDNLSEYNDESASQVSNATFYSDQEIDSDDSSAHRARGPGVQNSPKDDDHLSSDKAEAKLSTCLNSLTEKSYKERESALQTLKKLFSNTIVNEDIGSQRLTMTDSILKCLKRGKAREQVLAAECLSLIFVQLGFSGESASLFEDSHGMLIEKIENDKENEPEVRAACTRCLGLGIFLNNENDMQDTNDIEIFFNKIEATFASLFKGDGTVRNLTPAGYELHTEALSMICLLLSVMSTSYTSQIAQKHFNHFKEMLIHVEVDLRISAGETIACLLDSQTNLKLLRDPAIIALLKKLANDSSKNRSKKDKKQQRSSFRDVLRLVLDDDFETEMIKLSGEKLYLDNWMKRKQYHLFCDLLGSGVNFHFQENEYLREIFGMGPPIFDSNGPATANGSMSRFEKAYQHKDQFKDRTKYLNKRRDNKSGRYAGGGDDDDGY